MSSKKEFLSSYSGLQISAAFFNQSALSYDDALQRAMHGQVDEAVVDAMRREQRRAEALGSDHLVSVKINLGVALMNQGNRAGLERAFQIYEESDEMFRTALQLQPNNDLSKKNLASLRRNVLDRQQARVFNPHVIFIGNNACRYVVMRRLLKEQLSATLFTCDNEEDKGLIWYYESEDAIDADEWFSSYRSYRLDSRATSHDARSLMWRGEICWISSAEGKESGYMLFHCISQPSFLDQIERSRAKGALLPLLNVRGGRILAHHPRSTEKNWSPFVVGRHLYMTYSIVPHAVMHCDWEPVRLLLQCHVVQNTTYRTMQGSRCKSQDAECAMQDSFSDGGTPDCRAGLAVPQWLDGADVRGSSTAIPWTGPPGSRPARDEPRFLALGHVSEHTGGRKVYKYLLYDFRGHGPPFALTGLSALFTLPLPGEPGVDFHYAHGIFLQGEHLVVTYGVQDRSAFHAKLSLARVADLFAHGARVREVQAVASRAREFPLGLFGGDVSSSLVAVEAALRRAGHPLGRAAELLRHALPRLSLRDYAAAARACRAAWLRTTAAHDALAAAAGDVCPGGVEPDGVSCAEPRRARDTGPGPVDELARARVAAESGWWAYAVLVMRENAALSRLGTGLLTYIDVLPLVRAGPVGPEVLQVLRREHAHRERAARPAPHQIDAKMALAAALARHADGVRDGVRDAAGRAGLLGEAAGLLRSALVLDPGNSPAARALAELEWT